MVEINFDNLPLQRGFIIDPSSVELWDYFPESQDSGEPEPKLNYVFKSDSMHVVYAELPPETRLPWHTHEPHTSQLYWVLEGTMKSSYKDNQGEVHSTEAAADDGTLVYLPPGAHNRLENTGESTLKILSFKEGGGTVRGRLEHYVGKPDQHYDPKTLPGAGLDLLPRRGHVFNRQEDAVDEW